MIATVQIGPKELKAATTIALNKLLAPIRDQYENDPLFQETEKLAYPPPVAVVKKKKEKKIGTGYVAKNKSGEASSSSGAAATAPPTEAMDGLKMEEK